MRQVEIEFFCIGKTQICTDEVSNWLRRLGASPEYIGDIAHESLNEDATTNPALLIALAAKRCYMSFEPGLNPNVNKVRSELTDYFDNILKSGHGSVL